MYMDGLDSPYIISSILPDLSKPAFYAVVVADLGWNKGNFAPIRQYAKVCTCGKGSNACVSTSPLIRNTVYVSVIAFVQIACGFNAMLFCGTEIQRAAGVSCRQTELGVWDDSVQECRLGCNHGAVKVCASTVRHCNVASLLVASYAHAGD
jgi:hypothetical protein